MRGSSVQPHLEFVISGSPAGRWKGHKHAHLISDIEVPYWEVRPVFAVEGINEEGVGVGGEASGEEEESWKKEKGSHAYQLIIIDSYAIDGA